MFRSILFVLLFSKFTFLEGEGNSTSPYSTYLSNGIYLSEDPASPIIHTHFTKVLFHLPFHFVPDTNVYSSFYNSSCPPPVADSSNSQDHTSFCQILPHLIHHFAKLSSEISSIRFNLLNHNVPPLVLTTPTTNPSLPEQEPVSSEEVSHDSSSSSPLSSSSTEASRRGRRQLLIGGLLGSVVGYKIWDLFSSSSSISNLREDLNKDVTHLQEGIVSSIQLSQKVAELDNAKYLDVLGKLQIRSRQENLEQSHMTVMIAELTRSLLQTTYLVFYSNLFAKCQEKKISPLILSHDDLKTHLINVNNKLSNKDFKIAFPLDNISILYQIPVVDCLLNGNNLTISIRLPIIKNTFKYKLFSGISVPFKYKSEICSHRLPRFEVVSVNRNELFLVDRHTNLKCTGPLCQFLEHVPSNIENNQCLTTLTSTTTRSSFNSHCPLTCSPAEGSKLKIIQLDVWHYAILNAPPTAAILHFKSNNFVQQELVKTESLVPTNGCLVIKLSCFMQIYFSPTLSLSPPNICDSDIYEASFMAVQIWPLQWSNVDDEQLMLRSISHELSTMHPVNLSSISSLKNINDNLSIKYNWIQNPVAKSMSGFLYAYLHRFSEYCELAWCCCVSILIGILRIRVGKFCSSNSSSAMTTNSVLTALLTAPRRVESKHLNDDDVFHHFVLFVASLACIFILFLICVLVLLFTYFKSYWIRTAHRQGRVKGCVWSALDETPYLPGNVHTTPQPGMSSNSKHYTFPKALPNRYNELHPLRELEQEKMNFNMQNI